jgi:NTE family protein
MAARLGMVLSGGGSRGIAHIGILQALKEHQIEPECISGTSSGAIVGALYAAGCSAEAMLDFFETKHPFRMSKLSLSKPGLIDTEKIVSSLEEYFPEDRFEALGRRLFVAATDIEHGEFRVFHSGPLIRAILASCSIPMVFTPTEIGDAWFADGGIIDNFPVEPLIGLCEAIMGAYVSPLRRVDRSDLKSSLDVTQRALEVGMYLHSKAKFEQCGLVLIPTGLEQFGTFDTKHFREIFDLGYHSTIDRIDEIKAAIRMPPAPQDPAALA